MSKINMTPSWRDVKPEGFYIYVHKRISDELPFYVGKGSNFRGWGKSCRNRWWKFVAEKHGVKVEIIADGLSEADSHDLEISLISEYRDKGYPLVNISDGGEGSSGCASVNKKKVYCSNGMEFESTIAAAKWVSDNKGIDTTFSAIASAASGVRYSSYGLTWSYSEDIPKYVSPSERRANAFGMKVKCCHGNEFKSMSSAAEWLRENGYPKASVSRISMVCKGKRNKAYDRVWSLCD